MKFYVELEIVVDEDNNIFPADFDWEEEVIEDLFRDYIYDEDDIKLIKIQATMID